MPDLIAPIFAADFDDYHPGDLFRVRRVSAGKPGECCAVRLEPFELPPVLPDPSAKILERLEEMRENVGELVGDANLILECLDQITGFTGESGDIDPAGQMTHGRGCDRCHDCGADTWEPLPTADDDPVVVRCVQCGHEVEIEVEG